MSKVNKFLAKIAIFFVDLYKKYISSFTNKNCKFHPTCSEYSKQAFEKYGFFKGLLLTLKRIIRCNPFSKGGIDLLK